MVKTCLDCNKNISCKASRCNSCNAKKRGFPKECREALIKMMTGRPSPLKKPTKLCKFCLTQLSRQKYTCCVKCKWKIKSYRDHQVQAHLGKKPGNYIDGRSKFIGRGFYGEGWEEIRKKAYERDSYSCQKCFKRGGSLHAHHKIPFAESKDNSLTNLVTLCPICHNSVEKIYRETKMVVI